MEFLFTHPQPSSLVVDAVQQKLKAPQHKPTSADKDSKRLELFGRKVYSSATLALRMANYSALLANHSFDYYAKFVPLLEHLPDTKREILKAVVQEGYTSSRTALHIALDDADTAAHITGTSIVMRRASWLQQSSTPKHLLPKLEDLPCNKQNLFSEKTDQLLHSGKDSRTTLKTLGMYTPRAVGSNIPPIRGRGSLPNKCLSIGSRTSNTGESKDNKGGTHHQKCLLNMVPNNKFDATVEGLRTTPLCLSAHATSAIFHHRLRPFLQRWAYITADKWVLQTLKLGYMIPFDSLPPSPCPVPFQGPLS
ncbi:uncharacterized protein LOC106732414 isoform X2 [Pelodiscus sinensis]|uniref:uncharacterized protein LOC106732414 isoform X2 n=1 Tax=Pelodiscus sinensis TaxID=13735 RepID=UPI003F6AD5B3